VDEIILPRRQLYALGHDGVNLGSGFRGANKCTQLRVALDFYDLLFQNGHF